MREVAVPKHAVLFIRLLCSACWCVRLVSKFVLFPVRPTTVVCGLAAGDAGLMFGPGITQFSFYVIVSISLELIYFVINTFVL